MDHRLEAGATLFQQASMSVSLSRAGLMSDGDVHTSIRAHAGPDHAGRLSRHMRLLRGRPILLNRSLATILLIGLYPLRPVSLTQFTTLAKPANRVRRAFLVLPPHEADENCGSGPGRPSLALFERSEWATGWAAGRTCGRVSRGSSFVSWVIHAAIRPMRVSSKGRSSRIIAYTDVLPIS